MEKIVGGAGVSATLAKLHNKFVYYVRWGRLPGRLIENFESAKALREKEPILQRFSVGEIAWGEYGFIICQDEAEKGAILDEINASKSLINIDIQLFDPDGKSVMGRFVSGR